MKQIAFKVRKPNHFYAVRDDKGQLVEVTEPKKGQLVYEVAIIAGGAP